MELKKIYFKATDGLSLFGLLHKSNTTTKTVILSVHGMQSNMFKDKDRIESEFFINENIDYFCFNNRGSEIYTKVKKQVGYKSIKINCGSMWENVYECIYDLDAAVDVLLQNGYTNIILQGHSLGSIKSVIYYNYLIKNNMLEKSNKIKALVLLSLVNIQEFSNFYNFEETQKNIEIAKNLIKNNKEDAIIMDALGFPTSVKTFLQYFNEDLNFPKFLDTNSNFEELNAIKCPLFMRYGNINELIALNANEVVKILNLKVKNKNKDINFIDGADHSFKGKELLLTKQIFDFIKNLNL